MGDHIVRAVAANGGIRAFAAVTTETVQKAHELHKTSPVATAALGRTLTAAAMMSRMFKNEKDTLTIQIKGEGPLGGIVAVSDYNSNVRGYVHNPSVYLPLNQAGKLDVAAAVGKKGYINVVKDLGLKEPYVGHVELVSGEIGEDMAYYFASSEQVPTALALGVLIAPDESVITAGGYLIQLMPDVDESVVEYLEEKILMADSISYMLSEGLKPAAILDKLLGEKDLQITDTVPCNYVCSCSRERMERNLIALGKKELEAMAEEQHGAELQCHFCNNRYYFTEDELRSLL